jgi:ATP-binding cassette subfamily C protein LapB
MRPKDTTLVVVTHKLGMLNHFTRIVVLDRGRIVADGPRDEIIRRMRAPAPVAAPTVSAAPVAPVVPRPPSTPSSHIAGAAA